MLDMTRALVGPVRAVPTMIFSSVVDFLYSICSIICLIAVGSSWESIFGGILGAN